MAFFILFFFDLTPPLLVVFRIVLHFPIFWNHRFDFGCSFDFGPALSPIGVIGAGISLVHWLKKTYFGCNEKTYNIFYHIAHQTYTEGLVYVQTCMVFHSSIRNYSFHSYSSNDSIEFLFVFHFSSLKFLTHSCLYDSSLDVPLSCCCLLQ